MDYKLILEFVLPFLMLPIFWVFFRFKFRYVGMGVLALVIAYFLESYVESFIGSGAILIMIVFIAPVFEASIILAFTYLGKNVRSGIGIGLGFAMAENVLYYVGYGNILWTVFVVREFQDPMLHSTGGALSSGAWKKPYKYFMAIITHMIYNIIALTNSPVYLSILAIGYLGIIVFLFVKEEKKNKEKRKI